MTNLTDLTMGEALARLRAKDIKASELVDAHIAVAERGRPMGALITETFDAARTAARTADDHWAQGTARPMEGLPIAMKDLYCTQGVRTTAGSKILGNFVPTYESTVSQKLADAGAITLGKANLDEFAMGSSNTTSAYGPVISPWSGPEPDKAARLLVPGGSSGGSAAAVAARMVMGATGTDTGGSIRQPASVCGIVGIKPTYGRCSRFGIIAYASSLDQAGPMTRTVADAALMLREMAGFDPKDSTSVDTPVPDYTTAVGASVRGKRIGIPREYRIDGMAPEVGQAWDKGIAVLRDAGADIVDISLPHTKYALPTYYIIAPAEASSNLARYDGVRFGARVDGENLIDMYENTRGAGFGAEVRRRIFMGTYVLSAGYYDAYYLRAQKVRRLIRGDFIKAFDLCDMVLTPASPNVAFAIGENTDDPIQMYLEDVFTVTLNLAGLPGISVPVGTGQGGLPLGLQLIGKPFDEMGLFEMAGALEKGAAFDAVPPFVTAQARP